MPSVSTATPELFAVQPSGTLAASFAPSQLARFTQSSVMLLTVYWIAPVVAVAPLVAVASATVVTVPVSVPARAAPLDTL